MQGNLSSDIYAKAIDLLARREHSEKELRQKLCERFGYHLAVQSEIDTAIERCLSADYLSDFRFAEMLIKNRAAKGYGPRYITQELCGHNLNRSLIDEVFNSLNIDWFDSCHAVYQKKFRDSVISSFKDLHRCKQYLYRRGFSSDMINELPLPRADNLQR